LNFPALKQLHEAVDIKFFSLNLRLIIDFLLYLIKHSINLEIPDFFLLHDEGSIIVERMIDGEQLGFYLFDAVVDILVFY